MQAIRSVGVMLIAGLLWVVVSALLRSLGFGQGATMVVGFLLLFVLGPVLLAPCIREQSDFCRAVRR